VTESCLDRLFDDSFSDTGGGEDDDVNFLTLCDVDLRRPSRDERGAPPIEVLFMLAVATIGSACTTGFCDLEKDKS